MGVGVGRLRAVRWASVLAGALLLTAGCFELSDAPVAPPAGEPREAQLSVVITVTMCDSRTAGLERCGAADEVRLAVEATYQAPLDARGRPAEVVDSTLVVADLSILPVHTDPEGGLLHFRVETVRPLPADLRIGTPIAAGTGRAWIDPAPPGDFPLLEDARWEEEELILPIRHTGHSPQEWRLEIQGGGASFRITGAEWSLPDTLRIPAHLLPSGDSLQALFVGRTTVTEGGEGEARLHVDTRTVAEGALLPARVTAAR